MIDYAPELVKGLKTVLPTYSEPVEASGTPVPVSYTHLYAAPQPRVLPHLRPGGVCDAGPAGISVHRAPDRFGGRSTGHKMCIRDSIWPATHWRLYVASTPSQRTGRSSRGGRPNGKGDAHESRVHLREPGNQQRRQWIHRPSSWRELRKTIRHIGGSHMGSCGSCWCKEAMKTDET